MARKGRPSKTHNQVVQGAASTREKRDSTRLATQSSIAAAAATPSLKRRAGKAVERQPKKIKKGKGKASSSKEEEEEAAVEEENEEKPDVEEEADGKAEGSGSKTIVIEHCKQCQQFKKRALMVKNDLEKAVSDITVLVNPEKPRRGCFEVREEGGEVFISLQDMKRPFKPMIELDMDEVISDIIEKIKA